MASGKCPKCGSTDTRIAYGNYALRGLKYASIMAGPIIGAVLNGKVSPQSRYSAQKKMEALNDQDIDKYHCNRCGYEW